MLCDEIRVALALTRDAADRQGAAGVRVRLHLDDAPELAVLPWEFMFDPDPKVARFLALAEETPLVRYVDLPDKVRPLKVAPPLHVLALVSNPADDRYPELDVEREWRSLEEALKQPIDDGRLVLHRQERATVSSLIDTLESSESNILHFIGHGRFDEEHQDGLLAFEGERGGAHEVSAEQLGTLLYNEKSLRLVVLNACEGGRSSATDPYAGMAQTLVRMRVPAVVAMQFEITDKAAIVFARQFYRGIALGRPVDSAITEARMAIFQLVNEVEWATPVLYMRAPDGLIFDVPAVAPQPVPAPPPEPVTAPPPVVSPPPPVVPTTPTPATDRQGRLAAVATPRTLSCVLTLGLALVAAGTLGSAYLLQPATVGGTPGPTVAQTAPPPTPPATVSPTDTRILFPFSLLPLLLQMKVTGTISGGPRPDGIAVDERAGRIYIVNGDVGQLRILELSSKRLITTVAAVGQPVDVAVDATLGRAYVSQFKNNTVAVFDGGALRTAINVAAGPFAVAVHGKTRELYVTSQGANSVSIIDPTSLKVEKALTVGVMPTGIAIDATTDRAYVANIGSRNLTVIDTARQVVLTTIGLDAAPARVAVTPKGDLVLISNPDDNSLTVMSAPAMRVVAKVSVGKHPLGVLADPARARAFVAVDGSGTVAVVDLATNTLDYVMTVGSNPARFAYASGPRQLFVTNFGSDTVSVME